jgi:hypothetical protein
MISIKEQESLLTGISRKLGKRITVYAIGGTAMLFLGYKDSTLDIDLVFTREEDRKEFLEAARSLGYRDMNPEAIYGAKKNKPVMLGRIDERFDLFLKDVIDFTFSKNMEKRADKTYEFGNSLVVKIANPHDIILMKCATDRVKDKEDIREIIKNENIDWEIIIEEAREQLKLGRNGAVFEIFGTLTELKNMKVEIPKGVFDRLWSAFNQTT